MGHLVAYVEPKIEISSLYNTDINFIAKIENFNSKNFIISKRSMQINSSKLFLQGKADSKHTAYILWTQPVLQSPWFTSNSHLSNEKNSRYEERRNRKTNETKQKENKIDQMRA